MTYPFDSVLVANRGEIAARILRTVKAKGLRALLVAHAVDGRTPAMALADETMMIEGDTPVAAFLDGDAIIAAARAMGAGAIHPGYGFLSENAAFARAVEAAGIVWIGPAPETIDLMGDKISARRFVAERGFPVAPSVIEEDDPGNFAAHARAVGAPLLIKPSAGGGGKGMRIVRDLDTLEEEIATARSEGERYFGDGRLFIERYVENPRHIEVQVLGDGKGGALHLFERECSLQRRFQKIVEEAPSPALDETERQRICEAAAGIARACDYRGAGTVEFIYGGGGEFYFLEMNTRLQVEHPVTEMITGVDLVEQQLAIAAGAPLPVGQDGLLREGHAIEVRIYAEDPAAGFTPTTGPVLRLVPPAGARFDAGLVEGERVHAAFDPMIAKLIVHGADRAAALAAMDSALARLTLLGVTTNINYLRRLLADPDVAAGRMHTGLIAEKAGLAAEPPPSAETLDALCALAALAVPDVAAALEAVPEMHAAMGRWRN
ncbi:acetyl-CoA carboxylase biotin carboxylase subunit [Sphingopyxis macrogoltabida]|uniref:Biotin carboxylase n=1 Tax=Sphingopyxis macrogoltabida TaxID=33050 RepID=A0AAC9FHP3_SPHMC|nr:biotin carboxylase N-terminal domain-containing protein [Sphingopyxis macrogoltabida]ALJ16482.1 biotin carboxylase [Sphingopyxis macrogoltabida]AMU92715.1 biotin carboxylase [Sphingopyxis macrogoltabida]